MNSITDADILGTIAAVGKQLVILRSETEALRGFSMMLAVKAGMSPEHAVAALEKMAREARERALLKIGDTDPQIAKLLGVDEVLG